MSGDRRFYRPRVVDHVLAGRLQSSGIVLLEGPKACGKTFTAQQVARSEVRLDVDEQALNALRVDPSLVLTGLAAPQLIDEWQLEATRVWNFVRSEVDRRQEQGQYILAGSAVPDDDARRHTGAGRVARLLMRPMTLFESGDSTGAMSLAQLLNGRRPSCPDPGLSVPDIVDLTIRGGWPRNLDLDTEQARRANRDYLTSVAEVDVRRVDPSRKDPRIASRLLLALARNVALDHKVARLANLAADDDSPPIRETAYRYFNAFERLMVIELQPAWSTHLRSRATLRTAARTHFVDPSLAVAALQATHKKLLADLNTFGFLFESLVVRDLRVFAGALDGEVSHYRDSEDLEVDIIVSAGDLWGAFEVKLGPDQVDTAAANLLKFEARVDTRRIGQPAVLGVITATGYGYTRPDGVVVIPVGALGP